MRGTLKAIYEILSNDTTLVDMLAENRKWNSGDAGNYEKVNSIVPSALSRNLGTPYLVIIEGTEVKVDRELKSEDVYIRCYNDVNKTTIEITEILDRVKFLLDKTHFDIEDRVNVECIWETTLPILQDDILGKNFKESRYRVLVL